MLWGGNPKKIKLPKMWRPIHKIEEEDDETDLSGELACAGGACEIT